MKQLFYPLLTLLALSGCSRMEGLAPAAAPSSFSSSSSPGTGTGGQAGVLTAGEWSDLRDWAFWQSVLQRSEWTTLPATWQLYPTERYTVTLTSLNGQPLAGAHVMLGGGTAGITEAVTNRLGEAELFPTLFQPAAATAPLSVQVRYQGQTFAAAPLVATEHQATRTVAVQPAPASAVDIMFVVDATGSMGDEISYLKNELRDVIDRTKGQVPGTDLRLASVFYRDKGDDYLTRAQPFTSDANQLLAFVQAQQADGGGDFPEAVDEALAVALQQDWRTEARCRLLFLVLDAPPHPEAAARIQALTQQAASRGIRLIPVTASGIDLNTEFLMRALAVSTSGTYVFLTDDSGIGNTHLTPTVGPYQVEYLNNLLVRLITAYSRS